MNQQSQVAPRVAGGAVALPASSYWPYIVPVALLMTAVIGARAHEGLPIINKLRPALILGLFGGLLAWFRSSHAVRQRALNDRVFRGVAMYMAWAAVTVPFALWKGGAFAAIRAYLPSVVLTFVLLLCPPTRAVFDKLQRGFVLGCFATGCGALVFGYSSAEGRLAARGSLDANDLAAVMAMSLPLAMGLISREKAWSRRLIWMATSAVQLLVVVKAGSRGALIAIAVGTLVFVLGQPGKKRFIFLVLCGVGALGGWSLASANFKQRIDDLFNGTQDYNYTAYSGRKQVWARARVYMLENPIVGVGVGNFPFAEGETCRKNFPDRGCKWSATHNSWLQAGAELGFPGMILFVLMLFQGARVAWSLWVPRPRADGMHMPELFAALTGFATAGTFLSHAYFPLMFALLGVIAMAGVTTREAALAGAGVPAWPGASLAGAVRARIRPFSQPDAGPLQPLRPAGPRRLVPQGLVRGTRPAVARRAGSRRP